MHRRRDVVPLPRENAYAGMPPPRSCPVSRSCRIERGSSAPSIEVAKFDVIVGLAGGSLRGGVLRIFF